MKVLVIGSGGREHALVWKLAQSPSVSQLFCAPGNAGIGQQATCLPLSDRDLAGLAAFARQEGIDLTVVGGEEPLAAGIVDAFQAQGLRAFGPTAAAARIESDKIFAKAVMDAAGVPTAAYRTFDQVREALAYVRSCPLPTVVKAFGLARGKGVYVCRTRDEAAQAVTEIMGERLFGEAGARVIVEEFLTGQEASVLAFCHDQEAVLMVPSQDHKPIFDGDQGPNTGGVGCYSPVPALSAAQEQEVLHKIILPTLAQLSAQGCPFSGVLYAGLMLSPQGLRVLEFNARFGDPETQVVLPRLEGDLAQILLAVTERRLASVPVRWRPEAAVCVVMTAGGYPGAYEKGKVISGLDQASAIPGVTVFHAGTKLQDSHIVTNGGRVLGVTATAPGLRAAVDLAYRAVACISWEGVYYRHDIAHRALAGEVSA